MLKKTIAISVILLFIILVPDSTKKNFFNIYTLIGLLITIIIFVLFVMFRSIKTKKVYKLPTFDVRDHIDRVESIIKMSEYIKIGATSSECNNAVLVTGKSGIGKSQLIKKVLIDLDLNKYRVYRLQPNKSEESVSVKSYLEIVYNKLCGFSERETATRWLEKTRLLSVFSFAFNKIYLYIDRNLNTNNFKQMYEFISSELSQKPHILIFENSTYMDEDSRLYIRRLIKEFNGSRFIFEYTIENDDSKLTRFRSDISSKKITTEVPLKAIDEKDIRRHFESKQLYSKDVIDKLLNIYNETSENMCEFEHQVNTHIHQISALICYEHLLYKGSETSIETKLLRIIVACGGSISRLFINEHFKDVINDLNQSIERLFIAGVLIDKTDIIKIHDIKKEKFEANLNNNRIHLSHEIKLFDNTIKKMRFKAPYLETEILDLRYQIYSRILVTEMIPFFYEIENIQHYQNKHSLLSTVIFTISENFEEYILNSIYDRNKFLQFIIVKSYTLNLLGYAKKIFEYKMHENTYINLHELMIMTASETLEDFLLVANPLKQKYDKNEYISFIIHLIIFTKLLEHEPNEIVIDYGDRYLKNDQNKKYYEYGIFLRNYSELFTSEIELCYLKESADFLELKNLKFEHAQTLIALGDAQIRNGNYSKANRTYSKSQKMFGKNIYRKYFILNNRTVLNFYRKNIADQKMIDNFNEALSETEDTFERLSILSNLLSCYTSKDNFEEAKYIESKIMQISDSYDYNEYLEFCILNNRIQLYIKLNERSKIQKNIKKFEVDNNNSVNKEVHSDKLLKILHIKFSGYVPPEDLDKEYQQLVSKPYILSHLSYWMFRINPELSDY